MGTAAPPPSSACRYLLQLLINTTKGAAKRKGNAGSPDIAGSHAHLARDGVRPARYHHENRTVVLFEGSHDDEPSLPSCAESEHYLPGHIQTPTKRVILTETSHIFFSETNNYFAGYSISD